MTVLQEITNLSTVLNANLGNLAENVSSWNNG
jgi:hypothetical protein